MKIIILAQPNDNHTSPVKWALQQAGYKVACWPGLSWTEPQQACLQVDGETKLHLGPHVVEPGDAIWIRRSEPPVLNPKTSEADKKFVENEYRNFNYTVHYVLETLPVRCVNKYSAARFVNNKGVQLHLARVCGLKIPKTVLTNSPQAIKGFFTDNPNRMICKSLTPHMWERQSGGGVAITETFEITREELPRDEILTYAPGIYQDMVVKQFDVRTVLMGDRIYSFALHNPKKALDWRADASKGKVDVEIIATPPDVEKGLLAFARKTGACFGSIDFAIDMEGQWWFLEINEQGQFLWLDQSNREARTLERFCAFLTMPEGSTQSLEERAEMFPSFRDFEKSLEKEDVPQLDVVVPGSPFLSTEP